MTEWMTQDERQVDFNNCLRFFLYRVPVPFSGHGFETIEYSEGDIVSSTLNLQPEGSVHFSLSGTSLKTPPACVALAAPRLMLAEFSLLFLQYKK
jgi:hypothetical protein